jgi:hypothetical protein
MAKIDATRTIAKDSAETRVGLKARWLAGAGDDDRYARLDTGLRYAESDAGRTTKDEDAFLVKLRGVFRCCGSCYGIYQAQNWRMGLICLL